MSVTTVTTSRRLLAGRYLLGDQLGGGGTAVVYRARDEDTGRPVAIKELRPQFASLGPARRRFLREAEIARSLDHPGLVPVLDSGEDGGRPFLVMELIEGETLRQLLARVGPLGPGLGRRIVMRLADVLDHAHQRGIIHRDIKPENVFMTGPPASTVDALASDDGLVDRVRLADFGQARVTALASLTGTSLTWGTPEYTAPEVFARGRLDPRSDLYSLGVLLHELITGKLPWDRSQALARLGPALSPRGASPPVLAPTGAAAAVDILLTELLAPRPEQRPESARQVLTRLASPFDGQLEAKGKCFGCGSTLPRAMPLCLVCGQQVVRFGHCRQGSWKLLLISLDDDAASTGKLLDLLDALGEPETVYVGASSALTRSRDTGPITFLTESAHNYSKEEKERAIPLPAVLFDELDEATARGLERLFRSQGLHVQATDGKRAPDWRVTRKDLMQHALPGVVALGMSTAFVAAKVGTWLIPAGVMVGLTGAVGAGFQLYHRRRLRKQRGRFRLRGRVVSVPAADAMLAEATAALARVRVPEVRTLLAEVASSLYRLAAHTEASAQRKLDATAARRVLDAAPEMSRRLGALATRLDEVDSALAEGSEGELLQSLGRLERRLASTSRTDSDPHEQRQRQELEATRRRLEQTLERRQGLEEERDRLTSTLCHLLGRLRAACQDAEALTSGPPAEEARRLESAMNELDQLLLPGPGSSPG